jgi:hypothetical protein
MAEPERKQPRLERQLAKAWIGAQMDMLVEKTESQSEVLKETFCVFSACCKAVAFLCGERPATTPLHDFLVWQLTSLYEWYDDMPSEYDDTQFKELVESLKGRLEEMDAERTKRWEAAKQAVKDTLAAMPKLKPMATCELDTARAIPKFGTANCPEWLTPVVMPIRTKEDITGVTRRAGMDPSLDNTFLRLAPLFGV